MLTGLNMTTIQMQRPQQTLASKRIALTWLCWANHQRGEHELLTSIGALKFGHQTIGAAGAVTAWQ